MSEEDIKLVRCQGPDDLIIIKRTAKLEPEQIKCDCGHPHLVYFVDNLDDFVITQGEFYVRNMERGPVGNCALWWKYDNRGYTINIRDARKFSLKEIEEELNLNLGDGTYLPTKKYKFYPVEVIDAYAQLHLVIDDLPVEAEFG